MRRQIVTLYHLFLYFGQCVEDDSRGLERRKDMQAARGRRLVGERERTAPGSRNGPLSTYERRGSGKVPSRRNTGSSEEHQFCNDGEFEYEVSE